MTPFISSQHLNVQLYITWIWFFLTECLYLPQPLPVAFCYVPSQQQLQHYLNKKLKAKKHSRTVLTSPVDRKISFFGPQGMCGEMQVSESDETGFESQWRHLQEDKLWQTVLEYYYSLCNVSTEKRSQALNVYVRKRVKHRSERKESKKSESYAELAHKLGMLRIKPQTEVSNQESGNSEDLRRCEIGEALCTTTAATAGSCSSVTDCRSEEQLTSKDSTLAMCSNSCDSVGSVSGQTDGTEFPITSNSCLIIENSSQKSTSNECRTSSTSPGVKYTNVLIDMDKELMDRLSTSPSNSWSVNDDLVLVHFLCDICEKSCQGRSKVSIEFRFLY